MLQRIKNHHLPQYHNGCDQYCKVGQSETVALACFGVLVTLKLITLCKGSTGKSGVERWMQLDRVGRLAALILLVTAAIGLL